jgi:hypothetical protein
VITTQIYASGYSVTLTSGVLPTAHGIDQHGRFYPGVINDSADRMTILLQQVLEVVSRCLQVSINDTPIPVGRLGDGEAWRWALSAVKLSRWPMTALHRILPAPAQLALIYKEASLAAQKQAEAALALADRRRIRQKPLLAPPSI